MLERLLEICREAHISDATCVCDPKTRPTQAKQAADATSFRLLHRTRLSSLNPFSSASAVALPGPSDRPRGGRRL